MPARKTSDVPTRIYSYRCLPPIENAALVDLQFQLAHQYRNSLVEVEHNLRDRFHDIQSKHPAVGIALTEYEEANAAVDCAYDDIRAAKAGTSGSAALDLEGGQRELVDNLDMTRELRDIAMGELKQAKRDYTDDLMPQYETARAWAKEERKRRRKAFGERGLRHGAYVRVENAVDQAARSTTQPLRFMRWDGGGSIGTQLLAKSDEMPKGLTVSELHSCMDTRVRVTPLPEGWEKMRRHHRRKAARLFAWLRIGSNPDRTPIFAKFPINLHRPLPKDSLIKWVYIVRWRIGHQHEWRIQFTIESRTFQTPTQPVGEGTVALDLGWRRLFDDERNLIGIRAGYLVDDAGREREILLPAKILPGLHKCSDLASIRDRNLEQAQIQLSAWMTDPGRDLTAWQAPEGDGSKPMAERLRGYAQWCSAYKLHAFVGRWSTRRIAGDEVIFDAMVAWAKQDRHLMTWQERQRDRLLAHRKETWRVLAAELARTYATIVIEGERRKQADLAADDEPEPELAAMDFTTLRGWDRPTPEVGDPSDGREQRRMARVVAPGELRAALVAAAGKNGAAIVIADAKNTTRTCNACGDVQDFNARSSITHTCTACGVTWDQDANACRNLLKSHADAPTNGSDPEPNGEPPAAPAPDEDAAPVSSSPRRATARSTEALDRHV